MSVEPTPEPTQAASTRVVTGTRTRPRSGQHPRAAVTIEPHPPSDVESPVFTSLYLSASSRTMVPKAMARTEGNETMKGVLWAARDVDRLLDEDKAWKLASEAMRSLEQEPSLLGASPHLLATARR